MKTYKNLYPQIYNFGNLYTAYREARKGKRSRVEVAACEFDMEHNLLELQRELCATPWCAATAVPSIATS